MKKDILVSGIQPSGRLHIGNYLGALKNFVDLQNTGRYQCYFSIVDLHSLTEDFDPKQKYNQILDIAADFLAAGLDPKKSVIFLQSKVPAHTELGWILNTITPMGELNRMTQFKEKGKIIITKSEEKIIEDGVETVMGQTHTVDTTQLTNVGLFDYPVLMAADILLYGAKYVPVGNDQLQHLEFTRTLARKFNAKFGETFIEPKALLTETPRVMSLLDPMKKMSKSQPETCLFLDDSPEMIRNKVKRAVTDSGSEVKYDVATKPGVSNLLSMYSALTAEPIKKIEADFAGKNYGHFKAMFAEIVVSHFAEFRKKKRSLTSRPRKLISVLTAGSKKAGAIAKKKMFEVKKKIGLEK